MLGNGVYDGVAEGLALIVPGSVSEFVWSVLHEAGEHVLARRRDAWVGKARDHHVDVGTAREMTVLGVVVGALHVFDAGGDGHCAAKVRAGPGHGFEIEETIERDIYLPEEPRYL